MAKITSAPFGRTSDGKEVTLYTISNAAGMRVGVLDYGCTVQSIVFRGLDVALGYDDAAGYENGSCFFGAFVGRYANRIKGSAFELNGREYKIPANEGENHLHGVLTRTVFSARDEDGVLALSYLSPDGEEGFPGNLEITVRYALSDDNALTMDYTAVSDADTVVNFTNHTYFNLNGQSAGNILGHRLRLFSEEYTEGDADTLPTGRVLPVEDTPLDFRETKCVGEAIASDDPRITMYKGFDDNYVLGRDGEMKIAAVLQGDQTGIAVECYTTQPAIQLYTGNFITGTGKGGIPHGQYSGMCLETQHYPCSPNFPQFPSTVLHAGETYHHTTVYRFLGE